MAFFGKFDDYDRSTEVVTCGSKLDGCMFVKEFGEDSHFLNPHGDDVPKSGPLTITQASHAINQALTDILSRVELRDKPRGTSGFVFVYDGALHLAYKGGAGPVTVFKADTRAEPLGVITRWLSRSRYTKLVG